MKVRRIARIGYCGLLGIVGLCTGLFTVFAAQAQTNIASSDGKFNIPAYWFKAVANEPRPVVIGLHGCGGGLNATGQPAPIWQRYAGYFNAERMHFVMLDSFSPRGLGSICATPISQRTIQEEDRREDVFATIAWLAQQPSVDASRIIVVGWSHGAQTVLSVMDASAEYVTTQKIQPKAAAAFYPGCSKFVKLPGYRIQSPLLVMIGARDDWTLARHCVDLRDKLQRRQAGPTLHGTSTTTAVSATNSASASLFDLEVYPDSYHGFDGLGAVQTRQNVGNTRSGSATVGGNPAAQRASHARLFEFVAAQVGEPLRLSHEDRLKAKPALLPQQ